MNQWTLNAKDLCIFQDTSHLAYHYAALDANSKLYYWKDNSFAPALIDDTNTYKQDSLCFCESGSSVYILAYCTSTNRIHAINTRNKIITSFVPPNDFTINNITLYWSPRLSRTVCALQGTYNGYSGLYYGALDITSSDTSWAWWGYYYIGKPVFVEGNSTLWLFADYGYYSDYQYLCYSWCYTADLSWGIWHSMPYIGNDYHIRGLVGNTARNNGGGYALTFCNNEGIHAVKAVSNDGYPAKGEAISADIYKRDIALARSTSRADTVFSLYLISNTIYLTSYHPKEDTLRDQAAIFSNIDTFAVLPETQTGSDFIPILFCSGGQVFRQDFNPYPGNTSENKLSEREENNFSLLRRKQ